MKKRDQPWAVRHIPAELVRRFKAMCVLKGVTLGEALIEAMSDYLKKKGGE